MVVVLMMAAVGFAQSAQQPEPDITKVPPAAQPSDHFDVDAATDAYLNLMPPSAKAHGDAYFEGGYWLILWDFLVGAVISLLLLNLGWSLGCVIWRNASRVFDGCRHFSTGSSICC
jgi:hypothetical protein